MKNIINILIISILIFGLSNYVIGQENTNYSDLHEKANIIIYYWNGEFQIKKPEIESIFNSLSDDDFIELLNQINIYKEIAWITMAKSVDDYPEEVIDTIQEDLESLNFKRIIFHQARSFRGYEIIRDTKK